MSMSACSLVPDELKTAEQLIETSPDSALHILQSLSPKKYKSPSNRALYGLLMIRTLDKNLLPLKPDSLLDYSIQYYENHPDKDRLAACYLYKGRSYKYAFQYEKAMNYYLKAKDEVKDLKDNMLLGRITSDIADIYLYQREYQKAINNYLLTYDYYLRAGNNKLAYYALIYIGITYTQEKSFNKAQKYFKKVYLQSEDSLIKGYAIQNIGINYYSLKQYDSALYYLRKALPYPYIKSNRSLRYYYLADLFLDMNHVDSAFQYAQNSFRYLPDIRTKRECYRILTNCESLWGNIKQLNFYMAKYQDCSDSIRKIDAQTKGSYIETVHNSTKEVAKTIHKMNYLYVLLFVVIILSLIAFIIIHKRNLIEKSKTQQMHLLQSAKMHKEVLVNHREVLQNKIQERKDILSPERKKADYTGKIAIDLKVYEELLHINDIEYFYDEMNSVLNNLVNKLQNRYPSVTPREIMWCCLSLLQVPNIDMYFLLETNVESLKKMKQRLAPKFNLLRVSELEDFLIGLISE
jgi:tetratricopeptide (TPR) repeat protein